LGRVWSYFQRRHRIKRVMAAAKKFSRQKYPSAVPAWSLVAEYGVDECVVYLTYEPGQSPGVGAHHRFLRVNTRDLTVAEQPDHYSPERWGPYL